MPLIHGALLKVLLCIQHTSRQQDALVSILSHTHSTRRVAVDAKLLYGKPGDSLLQRSFNLVYSYCADHLGVRGQ